MAVIKGIYELGKTALKYGIPITYIKNLGKDLEKNPDIDIGKRLKNAFDLTGKDIGNAVKYVKSFFSNKKNMGGMMNARKKNMGLKMANGGPVGSGLKPVPSGNKGLSKLPTPVRNKMGYMKKGGMVKKRAKSSSKKSRGMGAAKRGGSFKGTF
jgi:hypothetical protein